MLQTILNLFKPLKKEVVEVKIEDFIKVESESVEKLEQSPLKNKGRPRGNKPAAKISADIQRKKK